MAEENQNPNESNEAAGQPAALTINRPSNIATPPTISTDNALAKDIIQLAREEIEARKQESIVKEKEVGIRGKEVDNAHEYAMQAINLQANDLTQGRIENKSKRRDYLLTGGVIFLFVVGFLVFCIQTGNQAIAMQIITYGGTALVSGVSGYFLGKNKEKNSSDNEANQ